MPVKSLKGGIGVRPLGFGLGVAAEEATDPNFNQTVLLLHADGSEGEGNTPNLGDPNYKAFRDNSTSTRGIVVNGDAYGNDFSPYYYANGYWSSLFDGANDNVKPTSTSSDFNLGTGQFTFEAFIYTFITTQQTVMIASGVTDFNIYINGGKLYMYFGSNIINGVGTINVDQWHHIVVQRDGSNYLTAYVDGTRVYYSTQTTDYTANNMITIGEHTNGTNDFHGYISNVRFVASTAVYSGASFTVPTTPLTAITNTKLLTCQSNRFVDNSTSSHALTIGGDPAISTNTPFTQSKTANVGSGFFDGTGDGLTTAGSSDFAFGTSDFTVELWAYPFGTGGVQVFCDMRSSNNNNTSNISALAWFGSNIGSYSGGNIFAGTDITIIANQWHHIAVQRISNVLYYSINGKISSTTPSNSHNFSDTGAFPTIGGNVGLGASMFTGYLADVRIVNGTGVYGTSNFSVPTAPLTAVTNTKILTCQYSGAVRNVGFVDDSKYNHRITRNGDVHMGTFSPFSLEDRYWSRYTDGTTNTDNHGSGITLGTNNFTIGMFVYPLSSLSSRTTLYADSAATSIIIAHDQLLVDAGSVWTITIDYTTDIVPNQWQWLQVDRTGSTFRVSINGSYVDGGGATSSGTIPAISLGQFGQRGGQARYIGHYSNFILINGANRGSIDIPTAPLTANSDTAILTHQSNRFVNNGNTSLTLTSGPDAKSMPFSPFAPTRSYSKDVVGGSMYSDTSGDYLQLSNTNFGDFDFGTGPFLIEGWIYYIVLGTTILGQTGYGNVFQRNSSSNVLQFFQAAASGSSGDYWITGTTTLKIGEWTHFALQRNDSGTLDLWVNGSRDATDTGHTSDTMKFHSAKGDITLRYWNGSASAAADYISNFRIKNSAVYTSGATITVPTAPFTADANTVLLLNNNNAGIIDHTMKNNLDTVNNVRIRTDVKKFGTGSIYFDGTDSVRWNQTDLQNEGMAIGTGPFTVEFFVYFDGDPNSGGTNGQASLIRDAGGNLVIQRYDGEWEAGNESTPQIQVAQSLSNQTWYHVAMTRDSSANLKLFINGTQAGSTATSHTTDFSKNEWHLGALNADASGGRALTGYMDEIRITAGVARYTSNFTAPTEPFANR